MSDQKKAEDELLAYVRGLPHARSMSDQQIAEIVAELEPKILAYAASLPPDERRKFGRSFSVAMDRAAEQHATRILADYHPQYVKTLIRALRRKPSAKIGRPAKPSDSMRSAYMVGMVNAHARSMAATGKMLKLETAAKIAIKTTEALFADIHEQQRQETGKAAAASSEAFWRRSVSRPADERTFARALAAMYRAQKTHLDGIVLTLVAQYAECDAAGNSADL